MVEFRDGRTRVVSLNEPVLRYQDNPILTTHQVNDVWTEPHLRVVTVHNAGVALVGSMSRSSWNLGGGPTPESYLVVGLG
jgi:hypothetical protein